MVAPASGALDEGDLLSRYTLAQLQEMLKTGVTPGATAPVALPAGAAKPAQQVASPAPRQGSAFASGPSAYNAAASAKKKAEDHRRAQLLTLRASLAKASTSAASGPTAAVAPAAQGLAEKSAFVKIVPPSLEAQALARMGTTADGWLDAVCAGRTQDLLRAATIAPASQALASHQITQFAQAQTGRTVVRSAAQLSPYDAPSLAPARQAQPPSIGPQTVLWALGIAVVVGGGALAWSYYAGAQDDKRAARANPAPVKQAKHARTPARHRRHRRGSRR